MLGDPSPQSLSHRLHSSQTLSLRLLVGLDWRWISTWLDVRTDRPQDISSPDGDSTLLVARMKNDIYTFAAWLGRAESLADRARNSQLTHVLFGSWLDRLGGEAPRRPQRCAFERCHVPGPGETMLSAMLSAFVVLCKVRPIFEKCCGTTHKIFKSK